MLYQTAHYEKICEFVTHFEGRREGASLLIHSVPLLRERRKKENVVMEKVQYLSKVFTQP